MAMRRLALPLSWLTVIVTTFALGFFQASDPDLGFHLATGRAVLALGRVPAVNVLSFTEPRQPWVLQQWLPATLFELTWRRWGPAGPLAVKLAVVVATVVCVQGAALRLGARLAVATPVTLLAAWAAAFRFVERPLIFSNLALAAVVLLLVDALACHRAKTVSPRRRSAPLVCAVLVTALACHLHAGAIFPMIVLVTAAAGLVLEPLRRRWLRAVSDDPTGPSPALALLAVLCAAVALAGVTLALYHPYGLRVLEVPFKMEADSYLAAHLVEFRPPTHFSVALLAPYWVLVVLTGVFVLGRVRAVSLAQSLTVAAFMVLSLRHVRLIDAFAIVAAAPLAASLTALVATAATDVVTRIGALAAVGLCVVGPFDHGSRVPMGVGLNPGIWPLGLFAVVRREGLRGPAFVSDGWAGPWLGMFYPRERAFFDPRFDAYSPGFYRTVYQSVRYGEPGWDATLDRYGVQLVILSYTTPGEARFQHGRENLRQLLARDPRWSLVAFDDVGEIFARREGINARQATELAIPDVDPDRMLFVMSPQEAVAGLEAELRRDGANERVRALIERAMQERNVVSPVH